MAHAYGVFPASQWPRYISHFSGSCIIGILLRFWSSTPPLSLHASMAVVLVLLRMTPLILLDFGRVDVRISLCDAYRST